MNTEKFAILTIAILITMVCGTCYVNEQERRKHVERMAKDGLCQQLQAIPGVSGFRMIWVQCDPPKE